MSDIYTIAELGAPLLKTGGSIFIYLKREQVIFSDYLLNHLSCLGLTSDIYMLNQLIEPSRFTGILNIIKNESTDDKYPRRIAVIKRMAAK